MDDCRSFLSPIQVLVCLGVAGRFDTPWVKNSLSENPLAARVYQFFAFFVFFSY